MLVICFTTYGGHVFYYHCLSCVFLPMVFMSFPTHAGHVFSYTCWSCVLLPMLVMCFTTHAGHVFSYPWCSWVFLPMLLMCFPTHAGHVFYYPCWSCVFLHTLVMSFTTHAGYLFSYTCWSCCVSHAYCFCYAHINRLLVGRKPTLGIIEKLCHVQQKSEIRNQCKTYMDGRDNQQGRARVTSRFWISNSKLVRARSWFWNWRPARSMPCSPTSRSQLEETGAAKVRVLSRLLKWTWL